LNHHLTKSISDVAWGMLAKATESKAAYAGSKVVLVDPKISMQQSTFSDWGYSLFAKAIEAPSFRAGSVHTSY